MIVRGENVSYRGTSILWLNVTGGTDLCYLCMDMKCAVQTSKTECGSRQPANGLYAPMYWVKVLVYNMLKVNIK
jgi:hypothetical protein